MTYAIDTRDIRPPDPLSPVQRAAVVAVVNVLREAAPPGVDPLRPVRDFLWYTGTSIDLSGSVTEALERFMVTSTPYQSANLLSHLFGYYPEHIELCDLAHRVAGHYPGEPTIEIIDPAAYPASGEFSPDGNIYRRIFRELATRYCRHDIYLLQALLETAEIDVLRFAQVDVPAGVTIMTVLQIATNVQVSAILHRVGEEYPGACEEMNDLAHLVAAGWPNAERSGMPIPGEYLRQRALARRAWNNLVVPDLIGLEVSNPGSISRCLAEAAPQLPFINGLSTGSILDVAFSRLYEAGSSGSIALNRIRNWEPPFIGILQLVATHAGVASTTRYHESQLEVLQRDEQPALDLAIDLARLLWGSRDRISVTEVARLLDLVHARPDLFRGDVPELQHVFQRSFLAVRWPIAAAVLHCLGEFRPLCEECILPGTRHHRLEAAARANVERFLFELESQPSDQPLVSQISTTLVAMNELYTDMRITLD